MNGSRSFVPWTVAAVAVVLSAIQFHSIRQLRSDMAAWRDQLDKQGPRVVTPLPDRARTGRAPARPADFGADQRLADLERVVAQLTRSAEFLRERGQLPQTEETIADLQRRFSDPTLPDRDRLRALQMLRRNGAFTDEVALQAVAWLQASTNTATQRSLLQQIDGATNAALKHPLLGLASAADRRVRERAVDALSSFAGDPQVEERLWNLLTGDPDERVREQAERALRGRPLSEARLAYLQQRAADAQTSLDERLMALRVLQRANADTSAATAALAQFALDTTDSAARRELFRAFDRLDDPAVKLPLVYGLQDPNPLVREEAVDALAAFRSDPAVEQWLHYVSQNDADPEVRREAFEALMDD